MIYFDNAATTLKKPRSVMKEISSCLKKYGGNPGRSGHALSVKASEKIYETRERISALLSYPHPERVVFTHNATYALNMAILGLVEENCHVIISDIEHNSVLRPVYSLCNSRQVEYSIFPSGAKDVRTEIEKLIRPNTKFIISTLASNVTGKEIPLSDLYAVKKKHDLGLIVDASQLIGHKKIDLGRYPCDALCAPGHKALFGIAGCGFCVFAKDVSPKPIFLGGSGIESRSPFMPEILPERLEAGTLATPSVVALSAGIDFIMRVGIETVEEWLGRLTDYTLDRLDGIKEISVYGAECGTISLGIRGKTPEAIADTLSKNGICTRGGLHCAPLAHHTYGTGETGSLRISYSYFNEVREIDKLYKVLRKICNSATV